VNQILLFPEDFTADNRVSLTGRRLRHVLEIHRAVVGEELRVGLCGGMQGRGVVRELSSDVLTLDTTLDSAPPPPLSLTLILALPRPKVLRRVVQTVTALGIKRLFLVKTWRVEKSYWSTPFLGETSLREQMVLGLEQACDTVMPQIEIRTLFKPFVQDEVPGIIAGTQALVAHPGALQECPRGVKDPVTLCIGPEGGLIPYEVEMLTDAGFCAVSMGPRIQRVESAVAAIVGRVS